MVVCSFIVPPLKDWLRCGRVVCGSLASPFKLSSLGTNDASFVSLLEECKVSWCFRDIRLVLLAPEGEPLSPGSLKDSLVGVEVSEDMGVVSKDEGSEKEGMNRGYLGCDPEACPSDPKWNGLTDGEFVGCGTLCSAGWW